MKLNKFFVIITAVMLTAALFVLASCAPVTPPSPTEELEKPSEGIEYEQPFTPKDKEDYVRNPDCGFYQPISFSLKPAGMRYSLGNYIVRNNLLHLRLNLADFRYGDISDAALEDLGRLLSELRAGSINAIVRFAYDGFNGYKDVEPELSLILRHVDLLGGVLANYHDVVTAVEVGMIGPWGEMHSSAIAVKDTFNALIGRWLGAVDNDTPILARRPKMISDYLGIGVSELKDREAEVGTDEYRLGVFNDGYLGSANDLGTFVNRELEVGWLNKQAAHTPYGGEVTVPGSKYNKIDYAAREMLVTHTSYLNELWNDTVIAEWKSTIYDASNGDDAKYFGRTAYEYVRGHLGYSFELSDIELPKRPSKTVDIRFKVKNIGFGNLLKPKAAELILTGANGTQVIPLDLDPTKWLSESTYSCAIKARTTLPSGEYAAYLRLREPSSTADAPRYCVAFANSVYNTDLNAEFLGAVKVS